MSQASAVTGQTLDTMKASLRGRFIDRSDRDYEAARHVYNGMIDKRPQCIVQCADAADVIAALRAARQQGLEVAIRGGGHSGAGMGVCDDGMVVDLSPMRGVRVDPGAREVRVDGGCTWGEVDHATHPFGLAVPSGTVASTGVAGLTLGGGHGYLTRKYGLTIDNLIAADMVLADGSFVTANEKDNPDLYWAIRGGGGNFGVITSFLFRAHPVHTVYAGPMFWSLDKAAEIMRAYLDTMKEADEDTYGFFAMMNVPPVDMFPKHLHTQTVAAVFWCHLGERGKAERAMDPIRQRAQPIFEHLGEVPFPQWQAIFDPLLPPGLFWYWKGDFFRDIPDDAIDVHIENARKMPSLRSTMHLYPISGAPQRVAPSDTAFAFRDANYSQTIVGIDTEESNKERLRDWARAYARDLQPYSAGSGYVNFMMHEEDPARVRASYGANYDRLVDIKTRYDPVNVFCNTHNIPPNPAKSGFFKSK